MSAPASNIRVGVLLKANLDNTQQCEIEIYPKSSINNSPDTKGWVSNLTDRTKEKRDVVFGKLKIGETIDTIANAFFASGSLFIVFKRHRSFKRQLHIKTKQKPERILLKPYFLYTGNVKEYSFSFFVDPTQPDRKNTVISLKQQFNSKEVTLGAEVTKILNQNESVVALAQLPANYTISLEKDVIILELFRQATPEASISKKKLEAKEDSRKDTSEILDHVNFHNYSEIEPNNSMAVPTDLKSQPLSLHLSSSYESEHKNKEASNNHVDTQDASFPLLSVKNAMQLAQYLNTYHQNEFLSKIASEMVNLYVDQYFPGDGPIQEISEILEVISHNDQFRVVNAILTRFKAMEMKDDALADPVIHSLVHFQKIYSNHLWSQVIGGWEKKKESGNLLSRNFFNHFSAVSLTEMLVSLTEQLNSTFGYETDHILIQKLLQATIILLDVMTFREIQKVPKDIHKKAYDAIEKFKTNENIEVRYLSNYGMQAFRNITDDESTAKFYLNRGLLVLKGLAKVAAAVDVTQPWHILSVFDAWPDFRDAFTTNEGAKNWYVGLQRIKKLVFLSSNQPFDNFLQQIKHHPEQALNEIPIKDLCFLLGLRNLASEIIESEAFDLERKKAALAILSVIARSNREDVSDGSDVQMRLADKFENDRKQLLELVKETLKSATKDPKLTAEATRYCLLNQINLNADHIQENEFSSYLFDKAVKESYPLFLGLQSIYQVMIDDKHLALEKPYYIPLNCMNSELDNKQLLLENELKEFLQIDNDDKVLVLQGDGGAGKTLSVRFFAQNLIKEYRHKNDYFPIVISLASVDDPFKDVTREMFKLHGITTYSIKDLKILWIFDGYDEILINEINRETNLYDSNHIGDTYKNSKIIFVTRKGNNISGKFCSSPLDPPLEKFAAPFSPEMIDEFFRRYADFKEKENSRELLWTYEHYQQAWKALEQIRLSDMDTMDSLLTNPLLLKIAADVLPIIVKQYSAKIEKENVGLPLVATNKDRVQDYISKIFEKQNVLSVKRTLFKAICCIMALRASYKNSGTISAKKFLEHLRNLAGDMKKMGKKSITPELAEHSFTFKAYFDAQNMHLSQQVLVYRNKCWEFLHQEYLDFFASLYDSPKMYGRLIEELPKYAEFFPHKKTSKLGV